MAECLTGRNPINLTEYSKTFSKQVLGRANFLEECPTHFELTTEQWVLLNQTVSDYLHNINVFIDPGALSSIKRMGHIHFRIAMILATCRKIKNGDCSENVVCDENDFLAATSIAESYHQQAFFLFENFPKKKRLASRICQTTSGLILRCCLNLSRPKMQWYLSHNFHQRKDSEKIFQAIFGEWVFGETWTWGV